ncbi:MAG: hypothetical protein QF814_03250 [Candidatus Marinimicrobia bacterium]|nr:hypothetical protein [Candidatus Neomarinimicrobiota bacterium]HJM46469.1 hypothetical protein [Candidatus Neomarinimicrobiota bacterium]
MKNILKKIQLIFGLCVTFLFGETSSLDSVINKFYEQPGIYDLKFEQHQKSTQSRSNGDLFINDNHHLMIRLSNLSLLLDNNLFYTFYPLQNKVVIDYYVNSEFNLISVLNGDWKNISVDRIEVKNQSKTIYLSIEDYGISGILKVDKYYNLKDLIINFSDNEFIQLHFNLKGYQSIDFASIIPDTTGWEVIDFRE